MKKFQHALKAAVQGFGKAYEPACYVAGGIQVRCMHCGGDLFQEQEALLNTAGATFVNLDWADKRGTALSCENCGLIQWYLKRPTRALRDITSLKQSSPSSETRS